MHLNLCGPFTNPRRCATAAPPECLPVLRRIQPVRALTWPTELSSRSTEGPGDGHWKSDQRKSCAYGERGGGGQCSSKRRAPPSVHLRTLLSPCRKPSSAALRRGRIIAPRVRTGWRGSRSRHDDPEKAAWWVRRRRSPGSVCVCGGRPRQMLGELGWHSCSIHVQ